MAITTTVQGLSELHARLLKLPGKVATEILQGALEKAGEPILHAARSKVPVDTGRLAASLALTSRINLRKQVLTVEIGPKPGAFRGDAFYAPFVEYGHHQGKQQAINKKLKGKAKKLSTLIATAIGSLRPFVPAQPYLRPAFDENREKAVEILKSELAARLDAVAKEKA